MNEWTALTIASFSLMVADVELTQSCLRRQLCREGNPLVPTGRAKIYAMQIPITAGIAYLSWRWRKGGRRYWWMPQVGISAAHGVGISYGLRFQW